MRRNSRLYGWVLAGVLAAMPAWAAYRQYGFEMQEIAGESVANGALYLQAVNTWPGTSSTVPVKPYTNQAAFVLPAGETITWARLYITVWGGTRDYTNTFRVYMNDADPPLAEFAFGTTQDCNTVFQDAATCVYGTGYGVWFVSVPVPPAQVWSGADKTNVVRTVVDDPSQAFDGRQIYIALAAVYCDRRLNNRFDFRVTEGAADIYRNQAGATNVSRATFSTVDTNALWNAEVGVLYTYGAYGERDGLFINAASVGLDDVANKQDNNSAYSQVPDLRTFPVTNLLALNSVRFSVNTNEMGSPCESSLRPQVAILTATHEPTPQLYDPAVHESGVALSWSASSGWVYRVEHCADLMSGEWSAVPSLENLTGTNAMMEGVDEATPGAHRLYRLVRERP